MRTARRLRQEAGGDLSPSLTAALATVERHGPMTPSELAARERIQRPTATRVLARLEERARRRARPTPQDRPLEPRHRRRPPRRALLAELRTRKTAFLAQRLEGLDAEDRAALERAADILERMLGGVSAGFARTFASLSVPNYRRYFSGQVVSITRQLDADRRRDVAGGAAHRQRRVGRV